MSFRRRISCFVHALLGSRLCKHSGGGRVRVQKIKVQRTIPWQGLLQTLCGRDPCLRPRGCWRRTLCRAAVPALGSPSHPSARCGIHVPFTIALLQVLWPLDSSFPDPEESHLLVNWWADYEMSPTDATGLRDPIFYVSRVLMKQGILEWQVVSSIRDYYPWVLMVSGIVFSWNVNHCRGSCVTSRTNPTAVTSVTDDRSTLSDPNLNKRSITSSQLLKCMNNTTPTRSYF